MTCSKTALASARVPTSLGQLVLHVFRDAVGREHKAAVLGGVDNAEGVLVRVHSSCFTGDVLGSTRCDCGGQLRDAMELIALEQRGILVYLDQEGRGIGLVEKLRAYELQDCGFDTVEANLALGHRADERDYAAAARILSELRVRSIRLLTNNPTKADGLAAEGVHVLRTVPLPPRVTVENRKYLLTKATRSGHRIDLLEESR